MLEIRLKTILLNFKPDLILILFQNKKFNIFVLTLLHIIIIIITKYLLHAKAVQL